MFKNFIETTGGFTSVSGTMLCIGAAILIGIFISAVYLLSGKRSRSMALTLAILPVLVHLVIVMVNGNIGAGVAVMGAFNLVRFRSIPGKSIDISYIFFAMAAGLTVGMGYIYFAFAFTGIVGVLLFAGEKLVNRLAPNAGKSAEKQLKVTLPEDMDYSSCFDDIFEKYTASCELERVKTTNMGMLFELIYRIRLKSGASEKQMLDEIRTRNGNLQIICGKLPAEMEML